MRILISSPVSSTATAGPATVLRELRNAFEKTDDCVDVITFSAFEQLLPIGIKQVALFFRVVSRCLSADYVLMLDPASTGPSLVLAALLTRKKSIVRIGGDFLWETYVERTKEPILLSDFYLKARSYTIREKSIFLATKWTLRLSSAVIFTTAWQQEIWAQPYGCKQNKCHIVKNPLPEKAHSESLPQKIFLCGHRNAYIKNNHVMKEVWEIVTKVVPKAVLDQTSREPQDYKEALKECYAVVLPSLSDVSPNTILEAVAHTKPFVMTKDTGIRTELVEMGKFVDTRSTAEIAKAVIDLCSSESYSNSVRAITAYVSNETWATTAVRIRAILESIHT